VPVIAVDEYINHAESILNHVNQWLIDYKNDLI